MYVSVGTSAKVKGGENSTSTANSLEKNKQQSLIVLLKLGGGGDNFISAPQTYTAMPSCLSCNSHGPAASLFSFWASGSFGSLGKQHRIVMQIVPIPSREALSLVKLSLLGKALHLSPPGLISL